MIRKDIFLKTGFDTSIKEYGHEDTVFGIQLFKNKVEIKHIDNPLVHKGLEDNKIFIKKSVEALNNLFYLYNNHPFSADLVKYIKILRWYRTARFSGLYIIFAAFYSLFGKLITKNLNSHKPNIILFDIYKLSYLCSLKVKS